MSVNVAVLGAGGMGSAYAAFLSQAGHDVQLIGRGGAHIEAIAERGLLVRPPGDAPYPVKVTARTHASEVPAGSVDLLIILTKTFDTAEAIGTARHVLSDSGVAMSLQNGLGNDTVVGGVYGAERTLVGVTTVGAARQEPGEISLSAMTAEGRSLTFFGGTPLATGSARAGEMATLLTEAGLPAQYFPDVREPLWDKLAMAVMSPISATLKSTVANVWRHPEGRDLVNRMFHETVRVAAADGVPLDADKAWLHAATTFEGTGEHYTSMCTDVRMGRRTELNSMAGEVARRGAAHGLTLPVHEVVLALLRTLDVE